MLAVTKLALLWSEHTGLRAEPDLQLHILRAGRRCECILPRNPDLTVADPNPPGWLYRPIGLAKGHILEQCIISWAFKRQKNVIEIFTNSRQAVHKTHRFLWGVLYIGIAGTVAQRTPSAKNFLVFSSFRHLHSLR